MSLVDFHLDVKFKGVYFRTLAAFADVKDAADINGLQSFTGIDSVGEQMLGGYTELGYNLLYFWDTEQKLIMFGRAEYINTQFKTPSGFSSEPCK